MLPIPWGICMFLMIYVVRVVDLSMLIKISRIHSVTYWQCHKNYQCIDINESLAPFALQAFNGMVEETVRL